MFRRDYSQKIISLIVFLIRKNVTNVRFVAISCKAVRPGVEVWTSAALISCSVDEGVDDVELVGVDGGQAVGQPPDVNTTLRVTSGDEAGV